MLLRVDCLEAEIARDGFAVERKPAAGQRARAERQDIGAPPGFRETLRIAPNISKYASK